MAVMGRRALPWLLAIPLLVAGSLAAHELAYRLAHPAPAARESVLDASGHGYLAQAPFALGALSAFLIVGLLVAGRLGSRCEEVPALPAWPLALLPPTAFALQEHLERALATGSLPLDAAAEPSFLVGLALQVPFGLLCLALGRWLGRGAAAVGAALAGPAPVPRRLAPAARLAAPSSLCSVRRAPLAQGVGLRAPPL